MLSHQFWLQQLSDKTTDDIIYKQPDCLLILPQKNIDQRPGNKYRSRSDKRKSVTKPNPQSNPKCIGNPQQKKTCDAYSCDDSHNAQLRPQICA